MSLAIFTVDVDRDANIPYPGRIEGISRSKEGNTSTRFESSSRGLLLLVELLEERGMRGTFFLEAEAVQAISERVNIRSLLERHEVASHGFRHEDLTGKDTGIPLSRDDIFYILEDAAETLEKIFSSRPAGFRAPYLHVDDDVLDAVREVGFGYDSSLTKDLSNGPVLPWMLPNGLMEVPLTVDMDPEGRRVYSYLWPMHEGKRSPQDYLRMMERSMEGVLVLATHSWHLVETFSAGLLDEGKVRKGLDQLGAVIDGALNMGLKFVTVKELLAHKIEGW